MAEWSELKLSKHAKSSWDNAKDELSCSAGIIDGFTFENAGSRMTVSSSLVDESRLVV